MTVPSYAAPDYPAPAARSRPTIVTVAIYLLYAVAVIQVINALFTFSIAGRLSDAVRDAYAGTDAAGAESVVTVAFVGGAVINLVLGAGFAVLGFFDGRGKNGARIVTWVIGGIALCCFGASLGSTALVGAVDTSDTSAGGPTQDELQRQLDAAMPSWYSATTTTLSVIALLAILGTVILLALPASNEFFRKPTAAAWDPSVPYPPYPGGGSGYGQPGYPSQPYPGQPQPGQPYPGQTYPGQTQPGQPYPGQPYPGQPYPGQPQSGPPYPGQPPSGPTYPGQPQAGSSYQGPPYGSSYPGQQGQPGQPAPGLPPYPGQETSFPPASNPFPPASDPFAPPSDPLAPPKTDPNPPSPTSDDPPPRPPTGPA